MDDPLKAHAVFRCCCGSSMWHTVFVQDPRDPSLSIPERRCGGIIPGYNGNRTLCTYAWKVEDDWQNLRFVLTASSPEQYKYIQARLDLIRKSLMMPSRDTTPEEMAERAFGIWGEEHERVAARKARIVVPVVAEKK